MFGGINVWQIAELKVIGEMKFGEWIDFGHKDTIYKLKMLVKVGRTTDDSPNLPNFPTAKHSCYTVLDCLVSCEGGFFVMVVVWLLEFYIRRDVCHVTIMCVYQGAVTLYQ